MRLPWGELSKISRFRQEWARIALTEIAHRAPKPTSDVGEKKKEPSRTWICGA